MTPENPSTPIVFLNLLSPGKITLVLLFALMLLGVLYRRFSVPVSIAKRAFLVSLRALLLFLIFLILLDPYRDRLEDADWLGVIVDTSASMGVRDPQGGPSRLEQLQTYFRSDPFWKTLEKTLVRERFSAGERVSSIDHYENLKADQQASRLLATMKEMDRRYHGEPNLLGWIFFTDGASTDIPDETLENLPAFSFPWLFITTGTSREIPNVKLRAPEIRSQVFAGEKIPAKIFWDSPGLSGKSGHLTVFLDGESVMAREISLDKGVEEIELEIKEPGDHVLRMAIDPVEGEGSDQDNEVRIWIQAQPRNVKVFYAEAYYKDENLFKKALEQDPVFEVDFATSLVGFAKERGVPFLKDRLYGLPRTREELFQYDAVILSDVKRSLLEPEQIDGLKSLVEEEGAALIMVGGMDSFGDGGYVGTAIESMLPVEISEEYKKDSFTAARGTVDLAFRPVPVEGARHHPLLELSPEPKENSRLWKSIPLFGGYNYVGRLKPGAAGLLIHPVDVSAFGPRILLAEQSFGQGKVLAFTSDVTHNWGQWFMEWKDEKQGWIFAKFWRRALKWLTEGRIRKKVSPLELVYDPPLLTPEGPLVFDLRLPQDKTSSVNAKAVCAIRRGPDTLLSKELPAPETGFRIPWKIPSLEPGDYRFHAVYHRPDRPPLTAQFPFAVQSSRVEAEHLSARHDLMKKLAQKTGGLCLSFSERDRFEQALGKFRKMRLRQHGTPLWHDFWVYFALVLILSLDWFCRKKWGLE